jgi:hypothetical protein
VLVAALVAEHGSVLVLTGSRFAESAHRAASLRKHTAGGIRIPAPVNATWRSTTARNRAAKPMGVLDLHRRAA